MIYYACIKERHYCYAHWFVHDHQTLLAGQRKVNKFDTIHLNHLVNQVDPDG